MFSNELENELNKVGSLTKEAYKGESCRVHGLGVKSSYNETLKTPE